MKICDKDGEIVGVSLVEQTWQCILVFSFIHIDYTLSEKYCTVFIIDYLGNETSCHNNGLTKRWEYVVYIKYNIYAVLRIRIKKNGRMNISNPQHCIYAVQGYSLSKNRLNFLLMHHPHLIWLFIEFAANIVVAP
jgi:hypothetical protein